MAKGNARLATDGSVIGRRTGNGKSPRRIEIWDRFLSFVSFEPNSGCWLWEGVTDDDGYPGFTDGSGRKVRAHRFSVEHVRRISIPSTIHVDHRCTVRCCVNPDHLDPVTPAVNIERCATHVGKRTHCPRGHAYAGDNVVINIEGRRICRTCVNARARAVRERKRRQS